MFLTDRFWPLIPFYPVFVSLSSPRQFDWRRGRKQKKMLCHQHQQQQQRQQQQQQQEKNIQGNCVVERGRSPRQLVAGFGTTHSLRSWTGRRHLPPLNELNGDYIPIMGLGRGRLKGGAMPLPSTERRGR